MNKKIDRLLNVILPNKKINIFVLATLVLGVISGAIFLVILNNEDKEMVVNQITTFFNSVNNGEINNFLIFKNSLIENIIFIIIVWILGMSIIGILINIFVVYLRGFILGFTVSSFILVYKAKGIISSVIYMVPTGIINLLITLILGVYSVMFTTSLFRQIFKGGNYNLVKTFKRYFLILIIVILLSIVSSISECYLIPTFIKMIIKLFI